MVDKHYRRQAVTEALHSAWNTQHVEVSLFDKDIFLYFEHAIDYAKVIRDAPWTVTGNLIIIEQWKEQQDWSFDKMEVWAQLHNIPPEVRNAKTASNLVMRIGIPSQIMLIDGISMPQRVAYLRATILIQVATSLKTYINIQRSGKEFRALIKYERLPMYSFYLRIDWT
ncbi:hypothetical protein NE237_003203 [Protea cynaroides]|uniref:DUF4283 domain-containing protein n=1 Tax=Protea cynaroides TaxID=273540 RepID=A0A9Q0KGZ8_9MAGN|nr:hypothetical protein NE237_003203 [Protea cynaroides]